MAAKPKTVKQLESIIKSDKPGRYSTGYGLYLNISNDKSLSWLYRYKLAGKSRWMGLGAYNRENTLAKMHKEAQSLKADVVKGIDPIEQRRNRKAKLKASNELLVKTFSVCTEEYLEKNHAKWKNNKTAAQWLSSLSTYAFPVIGNLPVSKINTQHIIKILDPIWGVKTETATRVRGRIELILSFAKVLGYRQGENPALWRGHLDQILPKPNKLRTIKHHSALPYSELPQFMQQLKDQYYCTASKALMLLILTACRTSEIVYSAPSEIKDDIWTIPSNRMKAGKQHRIPLSKQAMELVEKLDQTGNWLFSGLKQGKPISTGTMDRLLERMGRKDITVHGFRSTFRDFIAEKTNTPDRLAEMCLAHQLADSVEAAYQRADLLEKRKSIMQVWADYCYSTNKEGIVLDRAERFKN
jgi:integrase